MLKEKPPNWAKAIAYPFGGYQHFTEDTERIAAECDSNLAFSFETGVNNWKKIARFDVKRIAGPEDVSTLSVMAVLPRVPGLTGQKQLKHSLRSL